MKVMVLTTAFSRAAPVKGAFLFARYLHDHGQEVIFAALESSPDDLLADTREAGLEVHCFDMSGWLGLRRQAKVSTYVDQKGIAVVASDGLRPDVVNARLAGVTGVSTVRGLLREHYALDYSWLVGRLAAGIHARALKRLHGVFAISSEIAEHLVDLGVAPRHVHRVDNFVDVSEIRRAVNGTGPAAGPGVHIGYFGLLIRRKRLDVALRAVARLVNEFGHREVYFHIAGDGPLRQQLQRSARALGIDDRVLFHGFLPNPLGLMSGMDVVLLTSEREGVPRSLMEAMALGKTCVTSDFPGVGSLIKDEETGYIFQSGDVDGLSSLLHRVISGEKYLPSERLEAYMRASHDVERCGDRTWRMIQEIARGEW